MSELFGKNKLYLLSTLGLGDYYMIATNETEARIRLEGELKVAQYGYPNDRKVINIKLLSNEMKVSINKKYLHFSGSERLILPETLNYGIPYQGTGKQNDCCGKEEGKN